MREATLGGISALDGTKSRTSKPSRPGTGSKRREAGAGTSFRRLRSRATLIVASAGFSAIMVGIVCNAVLFQKGRHPSPLFGTMQRSEPAPPPVAALPRVIAPTPAASPAPSPVRTAAAVPEAVPPVQEHMRSPAPAAPATPRRPAPVHAAAAPHRPSARPARDAIAGLLNRDASHDSPVEPKAAHAVGELARGTVHPSAPAGAKAPAAPRKVAAASAPPARGPAAN